MQNVECRLLQVDGALAAGGALGSADSAFEAEGILDGGVLDGDTDAAASGLSDIATGELTFESPHQLDGNDLRRAEH